MALYKDVTSLKNHIDEIETIGQLRTFFLKKNLKLVVTILSTGFTCMDWDITQRQVAGILELGLKMKISKFVGDEILLETQFYESVRLDHTDPVDQKTLLEKLKQGISNCIKRGC